MPASRQRILAVRCMSWMGGSTSDRRDLAHTGVMRYEGMVRPTYPEFAHLKARVTQSKLAPDNIILQSCNTPFD